MVAIGEIRQWDTIALDDIIGSLLAQNGTALTLEAELQDHGRLEVWDGETGDAARSAIGVAAQQIGTHVETVDAVRKAVEITRDDVLALKSDLEGLDMDAGANGFRIRDDGSIENVWGYPDTVGDANQNVENERRQQLERDFAQRAVALMGRGDVIEDESAASMLDAIGAAGIGVDGKPITGVDAESGASDGADARDGELSEEAEERLTSLDLSQEQLDALANGQQIVVSDRQFDYLRAFYQAAGKDGILALVDNPANNDGNDSRTTIAAAAANFMTLSNENVTTPSGQTGGMGNLPSDIRALVENRYFGDGKNSEDGDDGLYSRQSIDDARKFGTFLSDTGAYFSTPGRELALNLYQQVPGYLELDYLAQRAPYNEDWDQSWQNYLDVASRNHEASTTLLAGDPPIGIEARDQWVKSVFSYDWDDDGRSAARVFDWSAESSHQVGDEGANARKTIAALPEILVPKVDPTADYDDQKLRPDAATFKEFATSFQSNPELANSLSRVVANNLESFIDPSRQETESSNPTPPPGDRRVTDSVEDFPVVFSGDDGNRLMFLAGQSEAGQQNLIAASELYKHGILTEAMRDPSNPDVAMLNNSKIAELDSRVIANVANAQTFVNGAETAERNDAAEQAYNTKRFIADRIADLVAVPVDQGVDKAATRLGSLGDYGSALAGAGIDAAREGIITSIIGDAPEAERVPMPDLASLANSGRNDILNDMLAAALSPEYQNPYLAPGGVPVDLGAASNTNERDEFVQIIGDAGSAYVDTYDTEFATTVGLVVANELSELEVFLTGNDGP